MSHAYILTEEGRAYSQEGIDYVLNMIRTTFNDLSEVIIEQGARYNNTGVLAGELSRDPENTYVFVSHAKGLEVLYDSDDIDRFTALLNDPANSEKTSWSVIVEALGLL